MELYLKKLKFTENILKGDKDGGVVANRYRATLGPDKNVLELTVMTEQLQMSNRMNFM